jgi:hypothetical protein
VLVYVSTFDKTREIVQLIIDKRNVTYFKISVKSEVTAAQTGQ